MAAYANSAVAILACLIANGVAENKSLTPSSHNPNYFAGGGYLAPFDVAFWILVGCGVLARLLWKENYGATSSQQQDQQSTVQDGEGVQPADDADGTTTAWTAIAVDKLVILCGLASGFFEGCIFAFTFFWTPILFEIDQNGRLPFGIIFATFMTCAMAGNTLQLLLSHWFPVEWVASGVFAIASICVFTVASTQSRFLNLCGMCGFQLCVGTFSLGRICW